MIDLWTLLRFAGALVFVLGLIGGVAWAARRYLAIAGSTTQRGKRRLAVIESIFVDGKSRLVLVRRDDREHLLMIGPTSTVVVESDITAKPEEAPPAALRAIVNGER
jgi:flagellar protein FliO/FliZ